MFLIGDFIPYLTIVWMSMNSLRRIEIIARRLPNIANPGVHPVDPSFVEGYGPTHNSVNIPAFIAAYSKQSPYTVALDQKMCLPKIVIYRNQTGKSIIMVCHV